MEEIQTTGEFTERAPLLLQEMMAGERFSATKVGYYAEDVDKDQVTQFAALVFLLPDGRNYISFRGTDKTITGWKEDFLMSCQSETAGAKEAVAYFNKIAPVLEGELILGGHSKGGNFAMYAAAFCEAEYKERIVQVYNNDGPGFREEVIQSPEFQELLPKIITIAPQSSIIGQLLSNPAKQHVIHSTAKGILQHDAMTWEAEKDRLVSSELDELSHYAKTTLGSWLESMDDESRESLCTTAFSLIESTNSETFIEFSGNGEIVPLKGLEVSTISKIKKTIEVFNLNCISLRNRRKNLISQLNDCKDLPKEDLIKTFGSCGFISVVKWFLNTL